MKNEKVHGGPGLRDPDAFYAALIALHERLSPQESEALNARLILLLVQELADDERAHALLAVAADAADCGL